MPKPIDRYAVFGNPIAHSKSPQIHKLFAEQSGQILEYSAQRVEVGDFETAVAAFVKNNGKGINVTVPFKQDAWKLASERSPRAERAGAVNTLVLNKNGKHFGDNTDGVGLVNDLIENHRITINNKKLLLLGAGGAVRGVIQPLLLQAPAQLVIANRTQSKAVQLSEDFADLGNIVGCGFNELTDKKFDVVINGTSASLQGELPPLPDNCLEKNACCYDMMYAAKPTVFMQWAQKHGANVILDGLGMLVEQAAESFKLWRSIRPETTQVINLLRSSL